jgi:hypothetical protein
VLAQSHWLAQRDYALRQRLTGSRIGLAGSMEAECFRATMEGRWQDALRHAHEWFHDEPFSSRPATQASFIATKPGALVKIGPGVLVRMRPGALQDFARDFRPLHRHARRFEST